MKYIYGTDASYSTTKPPEATVDEIINIIKDDVEKGKWNTYFGGRVDSITAHCKFHRTGFIYHDELRI